MNLIKQLNEDANAKAEMTRIADYWRDTIKHTKMADSELLDAIGDDLEQLEYSPTQIVKMTPKILGMIRSSQK